jgi:hypothetical protein
MRITATVRRLTAIDIAATPDRSTHRAFEVVGLAGQQHEIEPRRQRVFGDYWRGAEIDIADAAADRGSSPGRFAGAARTREKGYVAAGFEKPTAEISADRAGTDHEDAHVVLLRQRSTRSGSAGLARGSRARVQCLGPRQSPALTVPASAIIFDQNGMQVAVVENGVAHLREIAITADYGTGVEVNAGVNNGDKVILQPPVNLANGEKVQIAPEPPQATP